jgi:hypothetical protein
VTGRDGNKGSNRIQKLPKHLPTGKNTASNSEYILMFVLCQIEETQARVHAHKKVYFGSFIIVKNSWEHRWRRHFTLLLRELLTEDTREASN